MRDPMLVGKSLVHNAAGQYRQTVHFARNMKRPGDLLFEQRPGLLIFPRLGNHREHHFERPPGSRFEQSAGLRLHQSRTVEGETQRPPAHRRILGLLLGVVGEVRQGLVATDVHRAEDHRAVARCFEHLGVEPLLALPPGQRARSWAI